MARIKGELLGLEGEWELAQGDIYTGNFKDRELRAIVRVPEVGGLVQFIENFLPERTYGKDSATLEDNHWYRVGLAEGAHKAAKKMVEVAEAAMEKPDWGYPRFSAENVVKALKKFAGLT